MNVEHPSPGVEFALAQRSGRRLSVSDPEHGQAVAGAHSGHRWHRCGRCGFEMLTDGERRCPMIGAGRKPCGGRMLEVAPAPRKAHGERPADPVCERQGCGRRVFVRTARGEAVCRICLAELAAAQQELLGG